MFCLTWRCSETECGKVNNGRLRKCPCGSDKTRGESLTKLPGDWCCPSCQKNNFARRKSCFSCGGGRDVVRVVPVVKPKEEEASRKRKLTEEKEEDQKKKEKREQGRQEAETEKEYGNEEYDDAQEYGDAQEF